MGLLRSPSRRKAAPTGIAHASGYARALWERPCVAKGLQSRPGNLKGYPQ